MTPSTLDTLPSSKKIANMTLVLVLMYGNKLYYHYSVCWFSGSGVWGGGPRPFFSPGRNFGVSEAGRKKLARLGCQTFRVQLGARRAALRAAGSEWTGQGRPSVGTRHWHCVGLVELHRGPRRATPRRIPILCLSGLRKGLLFCRGRVWMRVCAVCLPCCVCLHRHLKRPLHPSLSRV